MLKSFFVFATFFSIFAASLLFSVNTLAAEISSSILITEINFAGTARPDSCKTNPDQASRCPFDKWLEITNFSSQAVSLAGYKLIFKDSTTKNNTLDISGIGRMPARASYLIGYREIDLKSTVTLAGEEFTANSGKLRNISSSDTKTIKVNLVYLDSVVQNVDLTYSQIGYTHDPNSKTRKSIELNPATGTWSLSTNIFWTEGPYQNFGTPTNTNAQPTINLDFQQNGETVPVDNSSLFPPTRPIQIVIKDVPTKFETKADVIVNQETIFAPNAAPTTNLATAKSLLEINQIQTPSLNPNQTKLLEQQRIDLEKIVQKQIKFNENVISAQKILSKNSSTLNLSSAMEKQTTGKISLRGLEYQAKIVLKTPNKKEMPRSLAVKSLVLGNLSKFATLALAFFLIVFLFKNRKELDRVISFNFTYQRL